MKLFLWFSSAPGNGYDRPAQSLKIYAVAEDLPEALRELDKILDLPNITGRIEMKNLLRNTVPQVFECPVAEFNISAGSKAVALISRTPGGIK